jgi:KaiC/GvpD/RAD55 family RecA-like ATPase
MKVDHKYKDDDDTKYLDLALRCCGMGMDYKHADLIITVHRKIKEKGGDFSIVDADRIQTEWKERWIRYDIESSQDPRTAGTDLRHTE